VSRQAFLPPDLNFYGLLGYEEEAVDPVTLFFEDLVLRSAERTTRFLMASDMDLAIKMQGEGSLTTKIRLQKADGTDVGEYTEDLEFGYTE
jgi:hypothetical protein